MANVGPITFQVFVTSRLHDVDFSWPGPGTISLILGIHPNGWKIKGGGQRLTLIRPWPFYWFIFNNNTNLAKSNLLGGLEPWSLPFRRWRRIQYWIGFEQTGSGLRCIRHGRIWEVVCMYLCMYVTLWQFQSFYWALEEVLSAHKKSNLNNYNTKREWNGLPLKSERHGTDNVYTNSWKNGYKNLLCRNEESPRLKFPTIRFAIHGSRWENQTVNEASEDAYM